MPLLLWRIGPAILQLRVCGAGPTGVRGIVQQGSKSTSLLCHFGAHVTRGRTSSTFSTPAQIGNGCCLRSRDRRCSCRLSILITAGRVTAPPSSLTDVLPRLSVAILHIHPTTAGVSSLPISLWDIFDGDAGSLLPWAVHGDIILLQSKIWIRKDLFAFKAPIILYNGNIDQARIRFKRGPRTPRSRCCTLFGLAALNSSYYSQSYATDVTKTIFIPLRAHTAISAQPLYRYPPAHATRHQACLPSYSGIRTRCPPLWVV